jgi:predicted transcriptional regulator
MEQTKQKPQLFYSYTFIFLENLSVFAKLIFIYLCRLADRNGKCFPSQRNMARCCNMSISTIGLAIRQLEQAGLLMRDRRFRNDGMQTSNWYKIKTDNTSWFYSYPLIFDISISAQSKIIYIYFCRQADVKRTCFPSVKQIAKACNIGQTKIRESLIELENVGLIERKVQFRPNQNGQTSNLYTVLEYITN